MKKLISAVLACVLAISSIAVASAASKPKYTMDKTGTVLQDAADRDIKPQGDLGRNPIIAGESPTTGLEWTGTYQPMMVQIVLREQKNEKFNGEKIYGVGIGYGTPWGIDKADILYEQCLRRDGFTRMTALFSDSFANNEPSWVGPIRSARIGHSLLQKEWNAGLIFAGGPKTTNVTASGVVNNIYDKFDELGATSAGLVFDLVRSSDWNDYKTRIENITNLYALAADVTALRNTIPASTVAEPRAFVFTDSSPYTEGYEFAYSINLDWGHKMFISHFYYDENENVYLRYSNDTPFMAYPTAEDASAINVDSRVQLSFSNVIVQRVSYEYAKSKKGKGSEKVDEPVMTAVGKGNADIFIGGRYIPGYWVREDENSPTIYLDDKGNEIQLLRGKTYIAQFPPESLLTYGGIE